MSLSWGKGGSEADNQRIGKWLPGAEFGTEFWAPLESLASKLNSGGIETHSNPNKAEAWQEVAVGLRGSSHALGLGRSLRGVSSLSLPIVFLWTRLNPHH